MTENLTTPPSGELTASNTSNKGSIVLRGSGVLYQAIQDAMGTRQQHRAALATPDAPGFTVVVVIGDEPADPDAVALPQLPVHWEPGYVLLGPSRLPGVAGCHACAQRRRRQNRPDGANETVRAQFRAGPAGPGSGLLCGVPTDLLAALVATEAANLARDPHSARTLNTMLKIALKTARISSHRVLPDPLCPVCSTMPADTAEAARIVLTRVRKAAPGTFRVRDAVMAQQELERLYTDPETGVIARVSTGVLGGCPISVAELEPVTASSTSQFGCGRALNFRQARLSAVTEALERYAARAPRGRRTMVRARYVDVSDRAVDPTIFGLFPDERHDLLEFPYRRYLPDREIPWVWGYSFARDESVLVPENLAYYARGPRAGADDFVCEVSNGCALGGCLAEAIFHGLLEITERDAFLMTWYARLPAPRVDIDSATDRAIPLLAQRARQVLGYDILAFDITLEYGIPSFWVLAVDDQPGPSRLRALCAAGAHPIPERALLGALCELTSVLGALLVKYSGLDTAAAAQRLLADPDQVRTMDHHALLYSHPEAFGRLAFLPIEGPSRSLAGL